VSHLDNDSPEKLAGHAHKRFNSIAVVAPGGEIGFEGSDAPARVVIISLAIVAGLAIFCFALMFGYDKYLEASHPPTELPSPLAASRVLAPAPQVEVHPWLDLPEMRAHENKVLESTGKDAAGHDHVPIEAAIDEVVAKINTKPGAPQGITTPGGQGRAFSQGLAEMPAAYQRPVIQGVIQGESKK
jgi:hypothetical protein